MCAACEAFQVGGPGGRGVAQQEVRVRCGREPTRHVLPSNHSERWTLRSQVQCRQVRHLSVADFIKLSVSQCSLLTRGYHQMSRYPWSSGVSVLEIAVCTRMS